MMTAELSHRLAKIVRFLPSDPATKAALLDEADEAGVFDKMSSQSRSLIVDAERKFASSNFSE
jgi:hypothetical protein